MAEDRATRIEELEKQVQAAEDRAARIEIEAQEMYETANAQLQKSLEIAHDRIAQLERENGTLALSVSVLRAKLEGADLLMKPDDFHQHYGHPVHVSPLRKATDQDEVQGGEE